MVNKDDLDQLQVIYVPKENYETVIQWTLFIIHIYFLCCNSYYLFYK